MKIDINIFNPSSIESAIRQLDRYSKRLEKACAELTEELARVGAKVVDDRYAEANEDKLYVVYYASTKNGWEIVAEGENVVFIEFGTGDDTRNYRHLDIGAEISKGSWSASEGTGTYARHGHWHYKGVDYKGTSPTWGFYYAKVEMKEQVVNIAKEVFKKWLM